MTLTSLLCSFAIALGLAHRVKTCKRVKKECVDAKSSLPYPINPENTIIAFDIHGVLFKHDYLMMVKIFLSSDKKLKLAYNLLNPKLWFDVIVLLGQRTVPEAFIMRLAQRHKKIEDLLPLIIEMTNAQIPIEDTLSIARELKKQGYTLHILSNIGEVIYRDLEKRYPHLLEIFDDVSVACATNNYVAKPNPQMYYHYLEDFSNNKAIIFIDDKPKNVRGALECGIMAILYSCPHLLYSRLEELDIIKEC